MRRRAVLACVAVALLAPCVQPANAAVLKAWFGSDAPAGYRLTASQAIRTAIATPEAQSEASKGGLAVQAYSYSTRRWSVRMSRGADVRVEIHIDDRTGKVVSAWTGLKANWAGARGSAALVDERDLGSATDALWVWLPLCVLFVLPFIDPRRPMRRAHLDVLLLLGFVVGHVFFVKGDLGTWLLFAYPAVVLLLIRLVGAGASERGHDERLVPYFSVRALLVIGALVLLARYGLNIVNSIPDDVAYASVAGADRILHGLQLYTSGGAHLDTYAPVTYLAYVPFTAVLPFHGLGDVNVVPAHAGAIAFDALTAVVLFLIGRRLRPGPGGTMLGAALAYAWCTYPLSWYVLAWNTNDALVGVMVLLAFLALMRPGAGGALLGLAGMTKFGPLALVPLFAVAARPGHRWRGAAVYVVAALVACAVVVLLFLPDGGLREFWDATIGYQLTRHGDPFSVWGLHPDLHALQSIVRVLAFLFALAVAAYAAWRPRNPGQIAALAAAALIATQLPLWHWSELYMVWFASLAFVGLFIRYRTAPG